MAVVVVAVLRLVAEFHEHYYNHVGNQVGKRMHRVGNHSRRTPQYTEGKLQSHKQQIHYTAQHRNAVNLAFTRIHNTFYFTSMKNGTTPVTGYKCIEKIKYPGNVICLNLTHAAGGG